MRILIYGLNFAPELVGIGKYTGEMAQYLAQNGHAVRVITTPPYYPHWKISKPYRSCCYRHEIWNGVDVVRCPLWVPQKLSGLKRLIHLFSFTLSSFPVLLGQTSWQPEVIINIAPSIFTTLPALLLGKLTRAKTWLHIQDFELDAAFDLSILPANKRIHDLASRMELALLKRFDRVSTISQRMLERLWEKGIAKERTVLFPNWIDTDLIKPLQRPSTFRKAWGISNEQIVILYSGNMGQKQGLEIVVQAARLLAAEEQILFLLCGDGAVKTQLQENAADLKNIRFYPLQPLEKLNELLNLADIHLLPQRADAADLVMPSKLSGMLASGRVVVATTLLNSELGQIVASVGIPVLPEDVDELATTLINLSADPLNRSTMAEKGRNWVLTHWAKDKVLADFLIKLESMI